ncbi:MAG: 3-deoxy-D-manno-octulosonic acid transferase, partial [Syntrophaceae bacterium]|nr:3-deoxy-D-manno-octulosonic acid transferase [Syntrophaceae bacterium]
AAIIIAPYYLAIIIFRGKYRKSIIPKLGGGQEKTLNSLKSKKRVWIHAVSVGEVTAASPIIAALKQKNPNIDIVFSTSTETGQEMARNLVSGVSAFIYFPLDLPFVVRKVIRQVRPDIFVMVETELWPNFLKTCKNEGVKTLMVNGRISPRSYGKYRLTGFFWKEIFNNLIAAGMISDVDSSRMKQMGMPAQKIQVCGNAKYDALAAMAHPKLQRDISRRLNVKNNEKFFVAGSTHPGEEEIIIDTYAAIASLYPDFKLIIVPRHIERTPSIIELLQKRGFTDIITMNQINKGKARHNEKVVLIDVIGELFKVYSVATIVYCGGSLVNKGGQNILEAAAWGKVIFYGPHMDDFTEEKKLLESVGCGITVKNAKDLFKNILQALRDPTATEERGTRGKEVVAANKGAAARYAAMISSYLR